MPRVKLDLTDAMSFEATEPGPYPMTVDEIEEPKKSKASDKNPQGILGAFVYFKFDDPNLDRKCGRVRRWYAFEGKGSGFFRELWKAATGEDLPVGESFDIDTDDALGRPVMVLIGNEAYEGRMQNVPEKVTAAA